MSEKDFFAFMSRMKYITRWGLMRSTKEENLSEHTLEVAMIAHALGVIRNRRFGGEIDPDRLAVYALYHDASEILTGDMPTPIKYMNAELKNAYKKVERDANRRLLTMLPAFMEAEYEDILCFEEKAEPIYHQLVKAADKLSALIKCMEEENMGNQDFHKAKAAQLAYLQGMELPEVTYFLEHFIESFALTIDEQNGKEEKR